jgi:group I intron endonuclease
LFLSGSLLLSDYADQCGIYKIECLENGYVYIGQSRWVMSRWRNHIEDLISGKHHNKTLLKDFQRYGLESFYFEFIRHCADKPSELNRIEKEEIVRNLRLGRNLYNYLI